MLHRGRLRTAQPRLAAAHLRRRRLLDRHPRLRRRQRRPRDGRVGHGAGGAADGELRTADAAATPTFAGSVVALGALGHRHHAHPGPRARPSTCGSGSTRACRGRFDDDSTRCWRPRTASASSPTGRATGVDQVWLKQRDADARAPRRAGSARRRADGPRHPVRGRCRQHCTPQLGVPGPWHERLPHFRLEFTPSSGEELQSEYLRAARARRRRLRARSTGSATRSRPCCRSARSAPIAADDLWLSPRPRARQRRGALHLGRRTRPPCTPVVAAVEAALAAVRRAAALGQGLRHRAGRRAGALATPARHRSSSCAGTTPPASSATRWWTATCPPDAPGPARIPRRARRATRP